MTAKACSCVLPYNVSFGLKWKRMFLPARDINAKDLTRGVKPVFNFAFSVKRCQQKGMHFI